MLGFVELFPNLNLIFFLDLEIDFFLEKETNYSQYLFNSALRMGLNKFGEQFLFQQGREAR